MKNVINQDGTYYKEFDVILVSSKEKGVVGDLVYNEQSKELFIARLDCSHRIFKHYLYFLSDEPIKENDLYLDDCMEVRKAITSDKDYWALRNGYKKIVATTNHLCYHTENKLKNDIRLLPNPKDEFIQSYIARNNYKEIGYELVLIELVNTFHGHFEEGGEDWRYSVKINNDGTINTKPVDYVQKRLWSELMETFVLESGNMVPKWSDEKTLLLEFSKWSKKQTKFTITKK